MIRRSRRRISADRKSGSEPYFLTLRVTGNRALTPIFLAPARQQDREDLHQVGEEAFAEPAEQAQLLGRRIVGDLHAHTVASRAASCGDKRHLIFLIPAVVLVRPSTDWSA